MAIIKAANIECYLEYTKSRQPLKEHETRETASRCTIKKNVQYAGVTEEGEFAIIIVLEPAFKWEAFNALSVELHFDLGCEVKNQITIPRSFGHKELQHSGKSQTVFRISCVETPDKGYRIELSNFAFQRRTSNKNSSKLPEDIEYLGQIWLEISRVLVKDEVKAIRQTILDRDKKTYTLDMDLGPSSRGLDYSIQVLPGLQTTHISVPQPRAIRTESLAIFSFLYRCNNFLEAIPEHDRVEDAPTMPPRAKRARLSRRSTTTTSSSQTLHDPTEADSNPKVDYVHTRCDLTPQSPPPHNDQPEDLTLEAQIQQTDQQIQAKIESYAMLLSEKERLVAKIRNVEGQKSLKMKHKKLATVQEKVDELENEVGALKAKLEQLEREE